MANVVFIMRNKLKKKTTYNQISQVFHVMGFTSNIDKNHSQKYKMVDVKGKKKIKKSKTTKSWPKTIIAYQIPKC